MSEFNELMGCHCRPTKSELFTLTGTGATQFVGEEEGLKIWHDLAKLKVCAKECSKVFHEITGTIHTTFKGLLGDSCANGLSGMEALLQANAAISPVATLDFKFRLIDEDGKEVCTKRVQHSAFVLFGSVEVNAPFHLKCFDLVDNCHDHKQTYRLQAKLLKERFTANNTLWVKDVDWASIVWDPDDKDDHKES